MSDYDYDLFVIGAGSGGVRAARFSAGFGAKVAVAEDRHMGGTCVNVGCIPKKLFVYAAHYHEDFEDAAGFGWTVGPRAHNWRTLVENKDKEISRLNGIYQRLLENSGCDVIDGRATVVDAHTVAVGDKTYTAERILVAAGSWPTDLSYEGGEHVITSNEAFYLDAFPQSVVIEGGGYIAVEFAGIFNGLGADVTLVYRGPMFMRGFDDDIRAHLASEMEKQGINLKFETTFERVEKALVAELGGPIEDRFGSFEREPMASASIAQVHRATLLDGREVAEPVARGERVSGVSLPRVGRIKDSRDAPLGKGSAARSGAQATLGHNDDIETAGGGAQSRGEARDAGAEDGKVGPQNRLGVRGGRNGDGS